MTPCAVFNWLALLLIYKAIGFTENEQDTHSSPGNKHKLDETLKAVVTAQTAYTGELQAATTAFQNASSEDHDMNFPTWVSRNYPLLETRYSDLTGAVSNYDQITTIVFGAGYKPLQAHKEMMRDALNPLSKTRYVGLIHFVGAQHGFHMCIVTTWKLPHLFLDPRSKTPASSTCLYTHLIQATLPRLKNGKTLIMTLIVKIEKFTSTYLPR
jgi:hypothetical protein